MFGPVEAWNWDYTSYFEQTVNIKARNNVISNVNKLMQSIVDQIKHGAIVTSSLNDSPLRADILYVSQWSNVIMLSENLRTLLDNLNVMKFG